MKTLYVSDLDGTLFNSKKKISDYSTTVLNRCIAEGMKFAVATARMPYGCDYRLKSINLTTPGILTNGVFIYDFNKKEYLHAETINQQIAMKVVDAFKKNGKECFMYVLRENQICIYYGDKALEEQTQYYSDRALEECKEIRETDDYAACIKNGEVFYFALTGTEEELSPVKEMLGADELVVFGDNYNDVPMIEIADRSYAPANAVLDIKEMVSEVLEDCDHDGVAKFLKKEYY